MLVRLWYHDWIHSSNKPVLSNEGKVSCSMKQRNPLVAFKPTTKCLRVRCDTQCDTWAPLLSHKAATQWSDAGFAVFVLVSKSHTLIVCSSEQQSATTTVRANSQPQISPNTTVVNRVNLAIYECVTSRLTPLLLSLSFFNIS